jgi:eukaryotic-like serine/threonine-protein kinase
MTTKAPATWTGPLQGERPPARPDEPPARIGQYTILSELGRGGMGVVYEAEHALLGRRVALKTLAGDEGAGRRERFLEEARTAARLRHPALVPVHDAGEADERLYLVMDLIRGRALDERLRETGPLTPDEASALLLPVVDALALAHRERIVHRDVKPANILVDEAGRALLVDFGLACDLLTRRERSPAERPLGTLAYVAPEQLRGEAVGPAADVYAFGATLYECLTGRTPYDAQLGLEAFARAREEREPTPPSALAPSIGPELEQVILRCLARRAEERFADAGELHAALQAARPWSGGGGELAPVRRLRGRLVAAAGLVAGLVAGAAGAQAVTRLVSGTERREKAPGDDPAI